MVNVRWETHQRSIRIFLRLGKWLIKVIGLWITTEQTPLWVDAFGGCLICRGTVAGKCSTSGVELC